MQSKRSENALSLIYLWQCLIALVAGASQQQVLFQANQPQRVKNVAIIGAGAAGASAAYELARLASTSVNITVFERNSYIGGRSTTVSAYDDPNVPVELGASIFVKVNKILVDAVEQFNLSTSSLSASSTIKNVGPDLGIWNGEEFVLVQATGGWIDLAKLFWRYGLAPMRTIRLMKTTVGKFLKMYDMPVFPFDSITQAVQDVGLLGVTSSTGKQYMSENGIAGAFGEEVVQASTRVNYAQNLAHIHGLEAMVCMATQGAMQVEGGNWKIFEHMLKASKASIHLNTAVFSISTHPNGTSTVNYLQGDDEQGQQFDSVILAAPFQHTGIRLGEDMYTPDEVPYVSLHVTLFASPHLLSPIFFNLGPATPVPRTVLTTLIATEKPKQGVDSAGSPGFFSISLLRDELNPRTNATEYLYKIFSPIAPSRTFLHQVLGVGIKSTDIDEDLIGSDITWLYRKRWDSYPYEYPRVTFEEVKLSSGVWYTGGMDSFISTMETNALMGKNVGRLVYDHLA